MISNILQLFYRSPWVYVYLSPPPPTHIHTSLLCPTSVWKQCCVSKSHSFTRVSFELIDRGEEREGEGRGRGERTGERERREKEEGREERGKEEVRGKEEGGEKGQKRGKGERRKR